jgi:predicted ATPase with chaperone activity
MLFRTLSAAVYGINADLVDIEVNLTPVRGDSDQAPPVTIVGLPDAAVRESFRFKRPRSISRPRTFAKRAQALTCR